MFNTNIQVNGVKETIEDMGRISHELSHLDEPMMDAALLVSAESKRLVSVDQGRTRASITPEVRHPFGDVTEGVVGSNVIHAPYVELGTAPHWPPLAALQTWASRHGVSAFLVARAIARRGTKAVRFLQGGLENMSDRVESILNRGVEKVIKK